MIPDHVQGAPIAAFIIVLIALAAMGVVAFSFQGAVHF